MYRTLTIILLLCLILFGIAVIPLHQGAYRAPLQAFMDAGHFIAFAVLAIALSFTLRDIPAGKRYLYVLLICVAMAVGIELVQPWFQRDASINDGFISIAGTGCALLGMFVWGHQRYRSLRWFYGFSVGVVFLAIAAPAIGEWRAVVWRLQHFPVLGDFEQGIELRLWRPGLSHPSQPTEISIAGQYVARGKSALHVKTGQETWPGVEYNAGGLGWDDYQTLHLAIFNPGEPFVLGLRIDDDGEVSDYHSRYNTSLKLETGWNGFDIPIHEIASQPRNRRLNTGAIRRMMLYVDQRDSPREFYLDNVVLN